MRLQRTTSVDSYGSSDVASTFVSVLSLTLRVKCCAPEMITCSALATCSNSLSTPRDSFADRTSSKRSSDGKSVPDVVKVYGSTSTTLGRAWADWSDPSGRSSAGAMYSSRLSRIDRFALHSSSSSWTDSFEILYESSAGPMLVPLKRAKSGSRAGACGSSSVIVLLRTANVADACCWGLRARDGRVGECVCGSERAQGVGHLICPHPPPSRRTRQADAPLHELGRLEAVRLRRDGAIDAARRAELVRLGG